ncbi:glycosyltransferase family 4 protein [Ulvibacter litoralis]|uniref:Glycosyltransferase involved in cell wall bisynthesis n=1 Tax=Ulvibacter litoralis TaxID=227084 RepID=A0A1G7GWI3_9FLAO|nr:glycosyltransferase family 4 protein [Ulvibacter litoralis]GHC59878.1 glycosyl transferase [Ulvibacter litoralis]SDE92465.1 Glycosyltransferase involved in cell wall bisynthesis [Ulvibacter litoralis]
MKVLQLIDSLNAGGAERMAVEYANELVMHIDESFLCATREEGLLKETIQSEVSYLFLEKRRKVDFTAIRRILRFVSDNGITVIHAHSSSFFLATIVKIFKPKTILIWHDHYGENEMLKARKYKVLKFCSYYFDGVISVNEKLKQWAIQNLKCKKVVFLNNFASKNDTTRATVSLKGPEDFRIVCLANIRVQKDHLNLLAAFKLVQEKHKEVSLHLLGEIHKDAYYTSLVSFIEENNLNHVYFYDSQNGVLDLLKICDLGVLASKSEGLPVALLEYGMANLPAVCTDVGQCKEVLNDFGLLVPNNNATALFEAILNYIEDPEKRNKDALNFSKHICKFYTFEGVLDQLIELYKGNKQ